MHAPPIKDLMRTPASVNAVHLSKLALQLKHSTPLPVNVSVPIGPPSAQGDRYLIPKPASVDVLKHFPVQETSSSIPALANASATYEGHNVQHYRSSMKYCVGVNVLADLHAVPGRYLTSSSVDAAAVAASHALETSSSIPIPASVNALGGRRALSLKPSIPSPASVVVLTDHHGASIPTKSLIRVLVDVDAHLFPVADPKDRTRTPVSVSVLMQEEPARTYLKSLTLTRVAVDVPMSLSVRETRDLITACVHVAASMHTQSARKDRSLITWTADVSAHHDPLALEISTSMNIPANVNAPHTQSAPEHRCLMSAHASASAVKSNNAPLTRSLIQVHVRVCAGRSSPASQGKSSTLKRVSVSVPGWNTVGLHKSSRGTRVNASVPQPQHVVLDNDSTRGHAAVVVPSPSTAWQISCLTQTRVAVSATAPVPNRTCWIQPDVPASVAINVRQDSSTLPIVSVRS